MSITKFIAAAAMAIVLALPCKAETSLTLDNGIAAGKALLSLYTQYKADGKLNLSNANNIANIATLATNIKGLTSKTSNSNFLSGLISGSKQLVSNQNSNSVISTLSSIAGLDTKALTSSVASSAASSLLSELGGKTSTTANSATTTAANALASLFAGL